MAEGIRHLPEYKDLLEPMIFPGFVIGSYRPQPLTGFSNHHTTFSSNAYSQINSQAYWGQDSMSEPAYDWDKVTRRYMAPSSSLHEKSR